MNPIHCNHVVVKFSEVGHSGAGWYAWDDEYRDEGSAFFDHKPTKQETRGLFCECNVSEAA